MILFLIAFASGFTGYHIYRGIRREIVRRAELNHCLAEIRFMQPIFTRLYAEALAAFLDGDYPLYEKTRHQIMVLEHRWKREVNSKLKQIPHGHHYP